MQSVHSAPFSISVHARAAFLPKGWFFSNLNLCCAHLAFLLLCRLLPLVFGEGLLQNCVCSLTAKCIRFWLIVGKSFGRPFAGSHGTCIRRKPKRDGRNHPAFLFPGRWAGMALHWAVRRCLQSPSVLLPFFRAQTSSMLRTSVSRWTAAAMPAASCGFEPGCKLKAVSPKQTTLLRASSLRRTPSVPPSVPSADPVSGCGRAWAEPAAVP